MLMVTEQQHQKEKLSLILSLLSKLIEQVSEHRLLGVTVDEQL